MRNAPVAVEIAKRAAIVGTAFGGLEHQRQVLVGRQDADRPVYLRQSGPHRPGAPRQSQRQRTASWGYSCPSGWRRTRLRGSAANRYVSSRNVCASSGASQRRCRAPPGSGPFLHHPVIQPAAVIPAVDESADQPAGQVKRVTGRLISHQQIDHLRAHPHGHLSARQVTCQDRISHRSPRPFEPLYFRMQSNQSCISCTITVRFGLVWYNSDSGVERIHVIIGRSEPGQSFWRPGCVSRH